MSPWYRESFGRSYLDLYPHRDADEALEDIRGLVRLAELDTKAPLLDLCCGAGRHLLQLHKLGFTDLTGLDLSGELLEVAAADLAAAGAAHVELIRSDMRDITHPGKFAAVLSLFTSFGYFEKDDDNRAVITAVERALRPGGAFVLDYLNADFVTANLVPEDTVVRDGRSVRNERRLSDDGSRVEKTVTVALEGGITRTFHESVRLYPAEDLRRMMTGCGLDVVGVYGSTRGDAHTRDSGRSVVVCRKPRK